MVKKERGNRSPSPAENIQKLTLPPTPAIPGQPQGTYSKLVSAFKSFFHTKKKKVLQKDKPHIF